MWIMSWCTSIKFLKICIAFLVIELYLIAANDKYNVLFIIFDDLRPALGAYGDRLAITPHLDKFAAGSYLFTRAYSQQAICAPSRNSLLTSRRPDTLHLYDFYSYWRTFAGNFTTLPQYFKLHDYYTYAIGKVFHPGISSNNTDDYPYSWSQPPFRPRTEIYHNAAVCPNQFGILQNNLICPVNVSTQPLQTLPDIESAKEAIRFIRSYNTSSQRPYFLAVGFHKPHINFRVPYKYFQRFNLKEFYNYTIDVNKPINMPSVAWNPYTDVRSRDDFKYMNISFPYGPISARQSAEIRQAYYASVSYVDERFGEVMEHVDRKRTIVLVTSDHGWSLGEHGEWSKYSNFDVALRVPLMVYTPEFPLQKQRIHSLVELVDLFPSLVDLAHLPGIPACNYSSIMRKQLLCTEGKSFYSILQAKSISNQLALSQYPRPGVQPTEQPNSDKPKLRDIRIMGYTLRTRRYRYTLWIRFHPKNFTHDWSVIYGEEMYDHKCNDREDRNLIFDPRFERIRMRLRRRLIKAFR